MTQIRSYLGIALACITACTNAYALISSEATLSGGYYKDFNDENRFPVYLYWNLNHTAQSGLETYLDVGANNDLIENKWGFYIYEGYVTVPLGAGLETAPFRRSRIQLGRQFLTEGFELSLLDGIQVPYYWSDNGGIDVLGGANYALQTKVFDFNSQLYGAVAHQRFAGFLGKAGYFKKRLTTDDATVPSSQDLGFASLSRSFDRLPLTPSFVLRGEWDLANIEATRPRQAYGELALFPLETVSLGASYSKRDKAPQDPLDTHLIYRLFALSAQRTVAGFLTWSPSPDFRVQGTVRRAHYDSTGGEEQGDEQELAITWYHDRMSWTPSGTHVKSYGGEYWQPALTFRYDVSTTSALRVQTAAAKISKINGMESWAYHTRAGVDFRPMPRFLINVLTEFERNHMFDMDVRGILFVSYFLF